MGWAGFCILQPCVNSYHLCDDDVAFDYKDDDDAEEHSQRTRASLGLVCAASS